VRQTGQSAPPSWQLRLPAFQPFHVVTQPLVGRLKLANGGELLLELPAHVVHPTLFAFDRYTFRVDCPAFGFEVRAPSRLRLEPLHFDAHDIRPRPQPPSLPLNLGERGRFVAP